jgi:ESS family glutamate:Na+ symporter
LLDDKNLKDTGRSFFGAQGVKTAPENEWTDGGDQMTIEVDVLQTLILAILVLFVGGYVNSKVGFLRNYNIPEPVVGGLLFALVTSALHSLFAIDFSFDMALRTPFMLAFFTTVGLAASLKLLVKGGPRVLLFLVLASIFLVIQNGVGVLMAIGFDLHPLIGLLSGSITLSGGHGTGAAYAGRFTEIQNIQGVMELAMACATFGLVIGGLLGGPVAQRLLTKHNLKSSLGDHHDHHDVVTFDPKDQDRITPKILLETLFIIVVCIVGGEFISGLFGGGGGFTLPVFIWALFIGVVIANVCELTGVYRIVPDALDTLGTVSLSLFLAMALMSLRLWELVDLAGPMLAILLSQMVVMAAFAYFITFRVMGSNYDAAIMAGGHCGFGMGATPTAVANMEALVSRYGPSPQSFLVVPLVGAFFIDITNAMIIQAYMALPLFGF